MTKNEQPYYNLTDDDIFYFLHIPKTAGTTLLTIIDNWFDYDKTFPETSWEGLLARDSRDLDAYKYFRGHFGYGLHKILKKKPIYITMLRNPLQQIISWYDQRVLSSTNNQTRKDVVTIDEAFSNPEHIATYLNPQTKWLALDIDPTKTPLINDKGERFDFTHYHDLCYSGKSDLEMLELAKKHLLEFPYFGIMERFQESLFLLCYTFGFRPVYNIINRNVALKKTQVGTISKETSNQIKQCILLDQEIYDFAKELFESRYSKMTESLHSRYYETRFDSMESHESIFLMLESHYNDKFWRNRKKSNSINYNFSQAIHGSGWHAREFRSYNGTAFRWTGPTNLSTIDFAISTNNDARIRFSTISQATPDIGNSIKLKVNDTPVSIQLIYRNVNRMIFEGIVEKRILERNTNYTRLTFEVNRTTKASPADDRLIGIALDWISISPR